MSFLEQEIQAQPAIIENLLTAEADAVGQVAAAIRRFQPSFVCIAARGTSDNAARYAQYALGTLVRLPVGLASPSIHTLYETPPDLRRALVIGISQSGQAADVLRVVTDARAQGALTLSMTNFPESPLAQAAEFHLALQTGEERSVAATKTYTAQLTLLAMLAAELNGNAALKEELSRVPEQARMTLRLAEETGRWAERYRYITGLVALGRGYNYPTAFEINLKVTELCYVNGYGMSEADFLHGPIAMVQPGFPVIVVAPKGKTLGVMTELIGRLAERRAESIVITNDGGLLQAATRGVPIPDAVPEWLTPIIAVMPGQVFALRLAEARGNPIDKPIGLTKVTVTV